MAVIEIPLLNSENFYEVDAITQPQYQTKHFLTDWWMNTLYYWERYNRFYDVNKPQYFVKKNLADTVTIQFNLPIDGITAVTLKMLNCDGTLTSVSPSTYLDTLDIAGNTFDDNGTITPIPLRTYQYKFKLSDIITDEGYYYFVIGIVEGSFPENQFISEPTWIKETHENTILIEYNNSVNDYDIAFEMFPAFSIRVDAILKYKPTPKLERTTFRNQKTNLRQLYSRNWRLFEITFGAEEGFNDVYIDKLSNIYKCDAILHDGKQLILAEGAEFEATQFSENYPLYTLKLPLEEYFNNNSVAIQPNMSFVIMELGDYPYVVVDLRLSTNPIPTGGTNFLFDYPTGMREVINGTEETDFIDELNAKCVTFGLTGFFEAVSGVLYFRIASDPYKSKVCTKYNTCLEVWFETNPSDDSMVIYTEQEASLGKTVVSVWRDSDGTGGTANMIQPDYVPNIAGSSFSGSYTPATAPDYDAWRMYIYTNNVATRLEITNSGTNIITLTGKTSSELTYFLARGGQLGSLDSQFLRNAVSVINEVSLQYMGITGFETDCFTRVLANDWKFLNGYDLAENNLNDAAQDIFFNRFYSDIAAFWLGAFGGAGTLSTVLQSPASAPTVLSDTSRTNLIIIGYTTAY